MRRTARRVALLGALVVSVGCGSSGNQGDNSGGAGGASGGSSGLGGSGGIQIGGTDGGATGGGGGASSCGAVNATIRDFKFWDPSDPNSLPDFQNVNHDEPQYDFSSGSPVFTGECGVTQPYLDTNLDAENKPQFLPGVDNSPCNTIQTANGITGAQGFRDWYRDSHFDKNMHFTVPIPNQAGSGTCAGATGFCFDAANLPGGQFFPIDNEGWGNQGTDANGVSHNFSFTTEIVGTFLYNGGETFTFSGDDDVWVFVNHKLAVDIGGVHAKLSKSIDFDSEATYLGITPGNTYSIRLFHAERHTTESNFRFETTIKCLHVHVS